MWINIGDTYSGSGGAGGDYNKGGLREGQPKFKQGITNLSNKSLCMIPQRFAIEMCNRNWILRNTIIWHKKNCMPASVKDRFTVDFEYLYFFVKQKKYYFEQQFESQTDDWHKKASTWQKNKAKGQQEKLHHSHKTKKPFENPPNNNGRNKRTVWTINPKPFKGAHFAVYPEELCQTPIQAGCPEGGIVLDPFSGSGTTGVVSLKLNRKFVGIELNPEYIKIAENRLNPILDQGKLF